MGGAYLFVYSKSLIDLSFEMQEAWDWVLEWKQGEPNGQLHKKDTNYRKIVGHTKPVGKNIY